MFPHHRRRLHALAVYFLALGLCFTFFNGVSAQGQEAEVEPDLTVSKDFGVSRSMTTVLPEDVELRSLREEDFARMTLDDPRLQSAYVRIFTMASGLDTSRWPLAPHGKAALVDLRRRGNLVTPLLLQLAQDNPYTAFEAGLLGKIYQIQEIDAGPFLDYAREVVEIRHQTMNSGLASGAAALLVARGDDSDVQRLRDVLEKRPYLSHSIEKQLRLKKFLSRAPTSTPAANDLNANAGSSRPSTPESPELSQEPADRLHAKSMPLLKWLVVLLVVCCLGWLAFSKRRK